MIPVFGSIVKPAGKLGPILNVVIGPPVLVGLNGVITVPTVYTFGVVYDKLAGGSSDTPKMTIAIPATTAFNIELNTEFAVAISLRMTTGSADNDTGALTAGDILGLNVGYSS
mgnify:CR=1 FL=1